MPTYRYRCEVCGEYDRVQRITDSVLVECENVPGGSGESSGFGGVRCGGRVERLITGTGGFILNGGGWYRDGY